MFSHMGFSLLIFHVLTYLLMGYTCHSKYVEAGGQLGWGKSFHSTCEVICHATEYRSSALTRAFPH